MSLVRLAIDRSARRGLLAAIDAAVVAAAAILAVLIRYDWQTARFDQVNAFGFAVFAAVLHAGIGWWVGLYRGTWRLSSFDEMRGLIFTVATTAVVVNVLNGIWRAVPVSAALVFGPLAFFGISSLRGLRRAFVERQARPTNAERVLVFGAGEGGFGAIRAMLTDPAGKYLPVGLIDDDLNKGRLRIMGVPVCGTRTAIMESARATGASTLIIAVPSANAELLRVISNLAADAELRVLVLPATADLLGGRVAVSDIRPITETDLLGRRSIELDLDAIAGYLTGRRVLVTGAGGSIGSELCRQINRYDPDELIMLDRDESGLHATQLSIDGRGQLDVRNLVVADIRDRDRLDEVWSEWKPHVVFHTAALKHVPLLEMYPEEAKKTNVEGTGNVLEVSLRYGVEQFVNVSTDKAAEPINVLGRTKRQAELLTAEAAERSPGTFLSVRFGNVLGSRGSVLTAFRKQIEDGGPVTVTHPDVTRFFMTVEEAVQLVIQAGAVGGDGEILILEMGQPVRVADVARQLIDSSGRDIDIEFTGLRPGEKLHERLLSDTEVAVTRSHPMILHVVDRDRQDDAFLREETSTIAARLTS